MHQSYEWLPCAELWRLHRQRAEPEDCAPDVAGVPHRVAASVAGVDVGSGFGLREHSRAAATRRVGDVSFVARLNSRPESV